MNVTVQHPVRHVGAMGAVVLLGLTLVAGAGLAPRLFATSHDDASGSQPAATRPSGAKVRIVSEEKLAHVPGKTLTVEIVELPPGMVGREHHHAGTVTVYVLAGTVRSQLAGGPLKDYGVGETFFEPPGAVHVVAANPSPTEPARFMAIHVADDGAQLTVYH